MAIVISCPACHIRLTLGDDRAGDRLECPQCGAMIKVPDAARPRTQPAQHSPVAPVPLPRAEPVARRRPTERDLDPETPPSEPIDKRIVAGIIAGVVALFVVGLAVILLAVRQPTETVQQSPEYASTPVLEPTPSSPLPPPKPEATPEKERAPQKPKPEFQIDPAQMQPELPNPQLSAQFLGSQGQGRRFCIIADTSGSMMGAKIADLKKQLLKTLNELDPQAEFFIYSFNSKTDAMPHPTWLKAGAPAVNSIRTWIGNLHSFGGTQPAPAFEAAFKLTPPPDVIFFMTDGLIPAHTPTRVVGLNTGSPKVMVNTIMFSKGPGGKAARGEERAEELLKQIATDADGKFTRYIPKD